MANRSDRNSTYPRALKRMLTLGFGSDPHRLGEVKRLFIDAHAIEKKFKAKALTRNDILGNDLENDSDPLNPIKKDKSSGAVISK